MKKLILIIDDDAMVRLALERVLTSAGYAVACAADGEEGIRFFRSLQPALVITDIIMPVREGVETIREIKHEHPRAKIIAISGGGRIGNSDLLKMAQRLGADRILAKPFDLDELIDLVRDSLGS